jgi:hypothetical protein
MRRASVVKPDANVVLNRLLRILCRSLPMYLRDARPWTGAPRQPAEAALDRLVTDQQGLARRVAQAILDQGGQPDPGPFPLAFAGMNDTSIDFLLQRVIEQQRRDLPVMERCIADLFGWPDLRALAEEALGNAQAHLDILERMKEEG